MANRKRGSELPSTMRRDIELYCQRVSEKEGVDFTIDAFTVRCGVSVSTMKRVMEGRAKFSAVVIKRINQVVHNGASFDGQVTKYVPSVKGKLVEIPTWLIPAIRSHLESKQNDKIAELEVGVVGGALRKICNGTRLSVRQSTMDKLLIFYNDYVYPAGPSPRDTISKPKEEQPTPVVDKRIPSGTMQPQVESSVHASEETTKLANRLIDAFNHLDTDDRELLCNVADCIARSSNVSAARAYSENLEKRLERQDGERATAESERDRRECGLLTEVNRLKALLDQWRDTDVEGLRDKVREEHASSHIWRNRYEKLRKGMNELIVV